MVWLRDIYGWALGRKVGVLGLVRGREVGMFEGGFIPKTFQGQHFMFSGELIWWTCF